MCIIANIYYIMFRAGSPGAEGGVGGRGEVDERIEIPIVVDELKSNRGEIFMAFACPTISCQLDAT